jgi:hypothetical protein
VIAARVLVLPRPAIGGQQIRATPPQKARSARIRVHSASTRQIVKHLPQGAIGGQIQRVMPP